MDDSEVSDMKEAFGFWLKLECATIAGLNAMFETTQTRQRRDDMSLLVNITTAASHNELDSNCSRVLSFQGW